ncbi:hypothetical protein V8D89_009751 [Ganoderma adspersum]
MTHLQPTTTVAGAGRGSSPQAQQPVQKYDSSTRSTQDPLYPPGLGFSPRIRAIARARGLYIRGGVVVEYGNGSSLLDGPLVGLGLHGLAFDRTLDETQTTRIRPAVCLDLPWPPVVGIEHVPHWPPQVALHEERMAQRPGRRLSMLDDLDLETKNLLPLDLERACTRFSCTLCAGKRSDTSGTSCEVEPVDPQEFMNFSFLDEDDYAKSPSRPSMPSGEEDGSELDFLDESDTKSTDSDSASSGSPPSTGSPRIRECPMKDLWFRAEMTSEDIIDLWCEMHVVRDAKEDVTEYVLDEPIDEPEEALLDLDPSWKPSQVFRVEEEGEEEEA